MKQRVYTRAMIEQAAAAAGGTTQTHGAAIIATAPAYEYPYIIFTPCAPGLYTARKCKSLRTVPTKYRAALFDAERTRQDLRRAAIPPETRAAIAESAARMQEKDRHEADRLQAYKEQHGDMIGTILYYNTTYGDIAGIRATATAEVKNAMQEGADALQEIIKRKEAATCL